MRVHIRTEARPKSTRKATSKSNKDKLLLWEKDKDEMMSVHHGMIPWDYVVITNHSYGTCVKCHKKKTEHMWCQ